RATTQSPTTGPPTYHASCWCTARDDSRSAYMYMECPVTPARLPGQDHQSISRGPSKRGSPSSGIGAQSTAEDIHWRHRGVIPGEACNAPNRTPTTPSPPGSPEKTWPPQSPQKDFGSPVSGLQVRSEPAPVTNVTPVAGKIAFVD